MRATSRRHAQRFELIQSVGELEIPRASQPLVRISEPFNDPAWLCELKLDGFRALAYIESDACRLIR